MALTPFVRQLPRLRSSMPRKADLLAVLRERLADGTLRPPIDKTFPLDRTAEAIRYMMDGKARGKVVITVPDAQQ